MMDNTFENGDNLIDDTYAEALDKAKDTALKYISTRMRTRREVMEHLQKKGYTDNVVRESISFLMRYQYLDDAAYCRAWIHDKLQFHPCGRQKMTAELSKKISDSHLVRMSLEEYYSAELEFANAQMAAMQKLQSRTGAKQPNRQQLARFLYSRGYSGAVIERVLDTLAVSAVAEEF